MYDKIYVCMYEVMMINMIYDVMISRMYDKIQ